MPFRKGESGNPATQFSSTQQPANPGRPEGVRNRATVMREALAMARQLPDHLRSTLPEIDGETTYEEVMALAQLERAVNGDTNAYKAAMDSAYGAPAQQIETTQRITIVDDL